MAKKATAKSRPRAGAKAAMAERSKDGTAAPKKKEAFGKRSKAARVAHSPKSTASKTAAKPARKSIVGKAVSAVSSTVSSVAGQATSLFKRGRAEKTR